MSRRQLAGVTRRMTNIRRKAPAKSRRLFRPTRAAEDDIAVAAALTGYESGMDFADALNLATGQEAEADPSMHG